MRWTVESLERHLLIGSTLVEGSTLSEDEAARVLAGRTVVGHPVHEVRELLNYRSGVQWLLEELSTTPYLSVDLLLRFHQRLFVGLGGTAGVFKSHANFTFRSDGTKHVYRPVAAVPEDIRAWVEEFNAQPQALPAPGAARLYARFQAIHPFEDGNGRIGRVLIAYWLHWKFSKLFTFYAADKLDHLRAVEATDGDDEGPLAAFFERRLVDEGT